MEDRLSSRIAQLQDRIISDYKKNRSIDNVDLHLQPDKTEIVDILEKLFEIVFAGYYKHKAFKIFNIDSKLAVLTEDAIFRLRRQVALALRHDGKYADAGTEEIEDKAAEIVISFFEKIPDIRAVLETDLQAAYDGDPATGNREEIILCYPGFYAITVNRLAHELFVLGVPLIPRIMTEHAHSITGIDIHPGAVIGKYFFIDHGTGVVVGETTVIGDYVKIYQGVTLGALSTKGGQSLRGKRRHPTIEDGVIIYSGASILGGKTVIGRDSVIGSNAFITSSLGPGSRVTVRNQELQISTKGSVPDGNDNPGQSVIWASGDT